MNKTYKGYKQRWDKHTHVTDCYSCKVCASGWEVKQTNLAILNNDFIIMLYASFYTIDLNCFITLYNIFIFLNANVSL